GISEITADHPEVQAMVEEAMKSASVSEDTLSPQIYAEVLEGAIAEVMKKNKDRFPGAPEKGGWVVDNYPLSVDHWSALSEKQLLPDTVICLKHTEKEEDCILCRPYLANRNENNSIIIYLLFYPYITRPKDNLNNHMEIQLSNLTSFIFLEKDQYIQHQHKITLPKFAEDAFPDTQEMDTIKKKIELFMHDWQTVESEIKNSSLVQVVVLEIAEQTPESLLNQTVLIMEKPFKYHGWELSAEDLAEEAEDLAAEEENEVDEEEAE
ncbi:KAD9 kinase, partial [Mionectes macconnelli]|nr:KAD9 kinase [Mionectes macconnelli]